MTSYDYRILGAWLVERNLVDRPITGYSRDEIKQLVEFIIGVFSGPRPCQVLIDSAERLVVPANADEDQMRMAIRLIEQMIINNGPTTETIGHVSTEQQVEIQKMLRHGSIQTTARYIHSLQKEGSREAIEALPSLKEAMG